jgi:hypothetical protein
MGRSRRSFDEGFCSSQASHFTKIWVKELPFLAILTGLSFSVSLFLYLYFFFAGF